MTHLSKAPRKPLLNVEQGKVFISHLDNDLHKGIAKNIFVDGMTNEEVANDYFYCKRQVERIRISLLKTVLKSLIEKQIPKRAIRQGFDPYKLICSVSYICPNCNRHVSITPYCDKCGQALDWSDVE